MTLVFLYGELKSGESKHDFISNSTNGTAKRLPGTFLTTQRMPLLLASNGLPVLLDTNGAGSPIVGELYQCDTQMKAFLDEYMCRDVLFNCKQILVTQGKQRHDAICYVLRDFSPRLLHTPVLISNFQGAGKSSDFDKGETEMTELLCELKKQLAFVYGTLKVGQPNHHWITKVENGTAEQVAGSFETVDRFPLVIATKWNIPFLLNKPGTGHNIAGELYEIDNRMLASLDILEQYPRLYSRHFIKIRQGDAIKVAQCYLLDSFKPEFLTQTFYKNFNAQEVDYVPTATRPESERKNTNLYLMAVKSSNSENT